MKRMDRDDYELCKKQKAELLNILRVAERRNEVLHGIIWLHDELAADRRKAAKRHSVVVGKLCCFW